MDAYWARYSSIYIDNEFVVTAIDRKCSLLHQIPLKEPLKLSFLAWTCALNAGLIQQNTNLPPKLPYSRLF
uniref:Reverse transcriptase zinc-binding domain-containing protein n=1 Tax=Panagrolaimus superbus TaxID=310955 RepID=A0A914Z9W4_9BILA